jgi:hypothetical protein
MDLEAAWLRLHYKWREDPVDYRAIEPTSIRQTANSDAVAAARIPGKYRPRARSVPAG